MELAVFYYLDWDQQISDIREQFPLSIDETVKISEHAGIRHPIYKKVYQPFTSDFVVNRFDTNGPSFVLSAKYAGDLDDPRTIEKLEIERRYWQAEEVPWFIVTEKEISKNVFTNINWLTPVIDGESSFEGLHQQAELFQTEFQKNPNMKLVEIAKQMDLDYDLEPGVSLLSLRNLLGKQIFLFDINLDCRHLRAKDLTGSFHFANKMGWVNASD